MEPNQPTPENSDDAVTSTTTVEEQHHQSRSYECTFCKRGFTNAQALGGHMNIHRKHKATLTFAPPPNAATTTTSINLVSNSAQGKNKPLPLFGDGSSDSRNIHQENVMKDPPTPAQDVDLELRLGQVESPGIKITTTRKFF
ncbi:hypothetical protein L2E82_20731 [Cichorium intybus]|uniref:Uncharacterized protein n=1 Tax=Cichorium intybus TaxID=13427 RepID=A0ACB9DUG8_CICIN|nr:hypothetical protein L2E82_20731 [Cichorium intybus]